MVKPYEVLERSFINGKLCEPGDVVHLSIDSPGTNLREIKVSAQQVAPQAPQQPARYFVAYHLGGGRYGVKGSSDERVGDFTGTKEEAEAEAARLIAGGQPSSPDSTDSPGTNLPDA